MNETALLNLLFELGHLRRIKHEGWRLAGVEHPESVAEHSLRAAQIAYFLAKLEGYANPFEVVTMLVFHDMGEARVGDVHKVANRYVVADEERAVREQIAELGEPGAELFRLWQEAEQTSTVAGKIARDADKLEQAFAAKELIERGYTAAEDWLRNIARLLFTSSAKHLLEELQKHSSTDWWRDLKKLSRPATDPY